MIYIGVFLSSTLCAYLAQKISIKKNKGLVLFFSLLSILIPSILGGMRSVRIGTDITYYVLNNLGYKISKAFENHWAFPLPAYEMLVTGEKTGELADMMIKVSEYYQELHKEQVARIKTFIEPLLTVFLTFMVGIIILAIVLPMFGMYETVQNY